MDTKKNTLGDQLTLLLFIPVALFFGVCLSIPVVDWALHSDGALAHELIRKGPGRLTRRCMMIVAVLMLPLLLRALNWKGLKDCGWQHAGGRHPARQNFIKGLTFGLGLMLTLVATSLITGSRDVDISYTLPRTLFSIFSFGFGAMAAGIFEETVVRGILFRKLMLRWKTIPVIIGVALFFAWIHFLKAENSAFEAAPYFVRVGRVFLSSITGFTRIPNAYVEMLNLALFSILLCLMLVRSGSIWLAAGFHMGVVWVKRMNSILAGSDHVNPWIPIVGGSSDFTDGIACAVLLSILIGYFCRKKSAP